MKTLLQRIIISLTVGMALSAYAQVGAPPVDQTTVKTSEAAPPKASFVSDGSRVQLPEIGFSIKPPAGWEVHRNRPGLSLLMQIPYRDDLTYQRTIQVATFNGPRYIDEATAQIFEDVLMKKFPQMDASIEGYRVRNYLTVEMTDRRKGLLFYSEFSYSGVSLMQAHVLLSTTEKHYLITYTDVASHFEGESNEYLNVAWNTIISSEIDGRTPIRFEELWVMGIGAGSLFLLLVLLTFVAKRRAKSRMEHYSRGIGLEDEDIHDKSGMSGIEVTFVSQKRGLFGRKKSRDDDDDDVDDAAPVSSKVASSHVTSGTSVDFKADVGMAERSVAKASRNPPRPPPPTRGKALAASDTEELHHSNLTFDFGDLRDKSASNTDEELAKKQHVTAASKHSAHSASSFVTGLDNHLALADEEDEVDDETNAS